MKRFGSQFAAFLLMPALMIAPMLTVAQSIPTAAQLQSHLEEFLEWKSTNSGGVDFEVKNIPLDEGNMTSVALVAEDVDLDEVTVVLANPSNWCEMMFLHLNVKACIFNETEGNQWVRLYMGRKFYQPPDKAEELQLNFKTGVTDDGVSWAELTAAEGPYGTSDYYIGLYAIKADAGVYTEFLSSQKVGAAATAAQDLYFHTLAANKIGFTVVGENWRGKPQYAKGQQGALERNIVRYLLALEVYLMKHHLEGLAGLQERAFDWYDATELYKKQLHEVAKKDYLKAKTKEYQNQVALQAEINQVQN